MRLRLLPLAMAAALCLTTGVRAQDDRVERLKAENDVLKNMNAKLERQVEELMARMKAMEEHLAAAEDKRSQTAAELKQRIQAEALARKEALMQRERAQQQYELALQALEKARAAADAARAQERDASEKQEVSKPYLGVVLGEVPEILRTHLGIEKGGAYVERVMDDSPAGKAGIGATDIVVSFDKKGVSGSGALTELVAAAKAGAKVSVGIVQNGKPKTVTVTLGSRPSDFSVENQQIELKLKPDLKKDGVFKIVPELRFDFRSDGDGKPGKVKSKNQFINVTNQDGHWKIQIKETGEGEEKAFKFEGSAQEILKQLEKAPNDIKDKVRKVLESVKTGEGSAGSFRFGKDSKVIVVNPKDRKEGKENFFIFETDVEHNHEGVHDHGEGAEGGADDKKIKLTLKRLKDLTKATEPIHQMESDVRKRAMDEAVKSLHETLRHEKGLEEGLRKAIEAAKLKELTPEKLEKLEKLHESLDLKKKLLHLDADEIKERLRIELAAPELAEEIKEAVGKIDVENLKETIVEIEVLSDDLKEKLKDVDVKVLGVEKISDEVKAQIEKTLREKIDLIKEKHKTKTEHGR